MHGFFVHMVELCIVRKPQFLDWVKPSQSSLSAVASALRAKPLPEASKPAMVNFFERAGRAKVQVQEHDYKSIRQIIKNELADSGAGSYFSTLSHMLSVCAVVL
jgi:hypothetical protein